jgi:hypothetical protein
MELMLARSLHPVKCVAMERGLLDHPSTKYSSNIQYAHHAYDTELPGTHCARPISRTRKEA